MRSQERLRVEDTCTECGKDKSTALLQLCTVLPSFAKEHSSSPQFTTGWVHFILKTVLFEKTKLPVTALTCPLQYFPRESCYQGLASTHSLFVN